MKGRRFIYFTLDKNNTGKQVFYILVNHDKISEIHFMIKK